MKTTFESGFIIYANNEEIADRQVYNRHFHYLEDFYEVMEKEIYPHFHDFNDVNDLDESADGFITGWEWHIHRKDDVNKLDHFQKVLVFCYGNFTVFCGTAADIAKRFVNEITI